MSDEQIDRISGLPDELIVHIISLLPSTKQRLRTSLISPRWRRLSSAAPVLDFPSADAAAIDLSLRLSSAQSLRRLFVSASASPLSFDRWIRFAASRSVLALALALPVPSSTTPLPPSLVLCSKSLSSLKLLLFEFPPLPPDFRGFPALKTLHLTSVDITDDSMAALLSSCPRLETLHLCYCDHLSRLEILSARNPCLAYLSLKGINGPVIVEAPSLRFIDFKGDVSMLWLRDVPNLHAAQIVSCYWELHKDRKDWMQLVSTLLDVKVLAVSCWFFEFMLPEDDGFPMLKNLKELHWFGVCIRERNLRALLSCLQWCPMLEKLCIHLDYFEELNKVISEEEALIDVDSEDDLFFDPYDSYDMAHGTCEGDSSVQPCKMEGHPFECDCDEHFLLHLEGHADMLSRLKAVTVTQFSNHRFGMQLVGFILRKAVVLELLQLTIMPDNKVELELLRKQLYSFSIASPHVQIELSEVSGCDQPRDYKVYQHLWSFP